jgi:6,7-dimethyl-8-ribityllumazine synthase
MAGGGGATGLSVPLQRPGKIAVAGTAPTPREHRPASGVPARARFAVVAGRFNEAISDKLVAGALAGFAAHGVSADRVDVVWVPGSFELPQAALLLARGRRYAGIACVGVVIRGETPHFEYVAREAAAGIRQVALGTGIPVTFGVITALTEAQAWDRAGGAVGNRGLEAASAAVEMAALARQIGRGRGPTPRARARG